MKVTDHAVLRWLERVEHINVQALRDHICKQVIRPETCVIGEATVIIEDDTIVTVLAPGQRPMSEKRARKWREKSA